MLRPFGSSDASASRAHASGRSPPAAATGSTHWLVGPDHAVRAHRLVRSRRARGSAMRSAPPERFSWFCRNRLDTDKCCASDEKGHHCFHANTSTGLAKQRTDISPELALGKLAYQVNPRTAQSFARLVIRVAQETTDMPPRRSDATAHSRCLRIGWFARKGRRSPPSSSASLAPSSGVRSGDDRRKVEEKSAAPPVVCSRIVVRKPNLPCRATLMEPESSGA